MWGKRDDMVVHETDPYNAEPPPHALAGHLVTPVHTFYVRNHGQVPTVDAGSWRLRVDGLVDEPLSLGLADLRRDFEHVRSLVTLQCAGNRRSGLMSFRDIPGEHPWGGGATSTAWWTGVRLSDVLARAGVQTGAAHVWFEAPDVAGDAEGAQPYGSSVPVDRALSPDVLLAWGMQDQDLPPVHGAPLRAVVPGYIGARSVKWLSRVGVHDEPSDNYFQQVAYRMLAADVDPATTAPGDGFPLGPVALGCEVLAPSGPVAAGRVGLQGYAHVGEGRHVVRVDVSTDGGSSWVQASLDEQLDGVWRLWECDVEVPVGPCRVTVRAWDSSATCQPEAAAYVWNPKGYVNSSWATVDLVGR